jgi:hypothetical protein
MATVPTVKIAFDLTLAGAGNFFTIGATPMGAPPQSGALPIAGDVLTDVTEDVRSITVRRGRSRETDKFDAGIASVVLDNRSRLYDPAAGTAVSPFAPSLKPRKALTVEANGQAVFTGQVEDIDLDYDVSGDSTTTFKAADGFTLLNQVTLTPGTATSQLSGTRINSILNDAGWPTLRRDVDAGQATLGADVIDDRQNALAYLNKIAASEPGSVFIGRNGFFSFRDRVASQLASGVVFADDGSGLPFSDLSIEYGTERLHSLIEIVYTGGTATALNAASETAYGLDVLNVDTLLSNNTQAQLLADFYSSRFGEPLARINSLTVPVDRLEGADLGAVLGLDLGDQVTVRFTPNGIGDALEQIVVVESIEHNIVPGNHSMRLTLSESLAGFILDASRLDIDTLGF